MQKFCMIRVTLCIDAHDAVVVWFDSINNSKLIGGSGLPKSYIVIVLECGYCKELSKTSAVACCLKSDENLLLDEVINVASELKQSGLLQNMLNRMLKLRLH